MYHTKSMEYIWANLRDDKSYENSDSRVGENATFVKNERFAPYIQQNPRGGKLRCCWGLSLRSHAPVGARVTKLKIEKNVLDRHSDSLFLKK